MWDGVWICVWINSVSNFCYYLHNVFAYNKFVLLLIGYAIWRTVLWHLICILPVGVIMKMPSILLFWNKKIFYVCSLNQHVKYLVLFWGLVDPILDRELMNCRTLCYSLSTFFFPQFQICDECIIPPGLSVYDSIVSFCLYMLFP